MLYCCVILRSEQKAMWQLTPLLIPAGLLACLPAGSTHDQPCVFRLVALWLDALPQGQAAPEQAAAAGAAGAGAGAAAAAAGPGAWVVELLSAQVLTLVRSVPSHKWLVLGPQLASRLEADAAAAMVAFQQVHIHMMWALQSVLR